MYQDLPSLVMQRPMKVHYAGDEIVQSELVILVAHVPDYIQTCTINILHEILTCKQNNLHLLLQHCTCVRMYVHMYVHYSMRTFRLLNIRSIIITPVSKVQHCSSAVPHTFQSAYLFNVPCR